MSPPAAAGHLLFGLLALRNNFVSRDQLLDALAGWLSDRTVPLAERLCLAGALDEDDRTAIGRLLNRHVKRHGNVRKSLAALAPAPDLLIAMVDLGDVEVCGLLTDLSPLPLEDSHPTLPPAIDPFVTIPDPFATFPPRTDPEVTLPPPPLPSATPTVPEVTVDRGVEVMRYREIALHRRGGLGEVWLACDEELGREVALKQIRMRVASYPESRARFQREAEITAKLEHPGIVPVYGKGTRADGRPYYAMRFVQGETLKDAIDRFHESDKGSRDPGERSLALRNLLARFVAVCDTVAYAHDRGVIHRDVKPANVLLGEYGETLLVDWGLARVLERADPFATTPRPPVQLSGEGDSVSTAPGEVLGTPAYASPEQASGRSSEMGPSSDVFLLGGTLYHLLTGRAPYKGESVEKMLDLARRAEVIPARKLKPSVPRALEAICSRAMREDPGERYQTAGALAEDVRRYLADEPVKASREPLLERAMRWGRRNWLLLGVGMLLLVAVVGLGVGLLVLRS